MEKIIAHCGLVCSECPAYEATQNDDAQKKAEVAQAWSEEFNSDIRPEHINCDGCLSEEGRLIGHAHQCGIRSCARTRQLANCAHCPEFACNEVNQVLNAVPAAKQTLTDIKNSL